ncbi:MAG: CRTAC1 family protein [Phycisphaerales bacterium JB039]
MLRGSAVAVATSLGSLGLLTPAWGQVSFTDITDASGIEAAHHDAEPVPPLTAGQNSRFGAGFAAGDYDNDGHVDIYCCDSFGFPNKLFRNNGDGTFSDVAAAAGVAHEGYSKMALFLDLNNDGWDDLIVLNDSQEFSPKFPRSRLYRNNQDGTFTDVTDGSGFAPTDATLGGATAGDYDKDGDLDLLVVGWYEFTVYLYRNDGDFTFTDVTDAAGAKTPDDRFHWAPVFIDLDGDGWQDIYAAVDFFEDYALRNNGDGTFTDISAASGLTHVANDMGVAVGDIDNDLDIDLYTTNMSVSPLDPVDQPGPNRLYVNDGAGVFSYGEMEAGVDNTWWGWGTWLFDADLDGDKDLLAINGWQQPEWWTPANFFLNDGTGKFTDASLGSGINHTGNSRALLPVDLEQDGDIDFLINDVLGPVTVYRNDTARDGRGWVTVVARGTVSNRNGVGAKVYVTTDGKTQFHEIFVGGSFHAGPRPAAHCGVGWAAPIDEVRVVFPSGREAVLKDVKPDQRLVVEEP